MASILCRNGRWRVQVRRAGTAACQTFDTEQQAIEWAKEEEARIKQLIANSAADPAMKAAKYQVAGVYLLLRGAEVRYVGRSVHIYRRLNDHDRKAMEWDSFRIWPCSNWIKAAELEQRLIKKYQPTLNVALTAAAQQSGKERRKNKDIFTRYRPTTRIGDETWHHEVTAAQPYPTGMPH